MAAPPPDRVGGFRIPHRGRPTVQRHDLRLWYGRMRSRRWRTLAVLGLAAAAAGCATSAVDSVPVAYYFYGPEVTLDLLDGNEIPPGDRALADLERSVALLELGEYADSARAIARARTSLERPAPASTGGGQRPPWRPEIHERVLMSTVEIADALALQDTVAAAAAADRAAAAIGAADCEPCGFTFTRVLAALAYEGARRFDDGLAVLGAPPAVGRARDLMEAMRERLERGIAGAEPAGLAPPPVDAGRALEIVLLLGRGPYKSPDRLTVGDKERIRWVEYLPRGPQAVTWAAVEVEDPEISVELTDVEHLAAVALRRRAEEVIAAGGAVAGDPGDLRDWSTLPASLQLLRFEVPPELEALDLVYYSPDGFEVDRETLDLPLGWWGGPLFVVRRMP